MIAIRVRTPKGQFTYRVEPGDDASVLGDQIAASIPEAQPGTIRLAEDPRAENGQPLSALQGPISGLGLRHGSLLFASYEKTESEGAGGASEGKAAEKPVKKAQGDAMDKFYEGKTGRIEQNKKSGGSSRHVALSDMALEPFDSGYHKEHQIKHLSFQAWLRKLQNDKASLGLENPMYKVKVPCPGGGHAPWPAGICTKCQPSAVTLQRQPYRMVDHVEFSRVAAIENMVSFWRMTGLQRFGYLIGRYAPYEKVPMGVKAVIEGVYEPPQEPLADGMTVQWPWEEKGRIEALAHECGLEIVGVLYTDLRPRGGDAATSEGKVEFKRRPDTFFMSSVEVRMAAVHQQAFPHPWANAAGMYDSRFITCVLSGDKDETISVEAFQVSNQTCSLVDADLVVPSTDPSVMLLRGESDKADRRTAQTNAPPKRYIPDIFYRQKNEYGTDAQHTVNAQNPAFPVDYLLVNLTHGAPIDPKPLFYSSAFPQANRPGLQDQSLERVVSSYKSALRAANAPNAGFSASYIDPATGVSPVAAWLSDWNLLAFLPEAGLFEPEALALMAKVAVDVHNTGALAQLYGTASWQTFLAIAIDDEPEPAPAPAPPRAPSPPPRDRFVYDPDDDSDLSVHTAQSDDVLDLTNDRDDDDGGNYDTEAWEEDVGNEEAGHEEAGQVACPHCTFLNAPGSRDCDVCGLPM